MRRTRKFSALGDVQTVVNRAPTLDAAAKQLGVNRSTLTRWMQQGKVKRPGSAPAVVAPEIPATAEGWKDGVLKGHALSQTERTLVNVADEALRLALNPETPAFTRLSAMGRFAAIVRQLNLEAKRLDAVGPVRMASPPAVANARPRRVAGDPRAVLMAVK